MTKFDEVYKAEKDKESLSHLSNLATAKIALENEIRENQALIAQIDELGEKEHISLSEVKALYNKAMQKRI